MKNSSKGLFTWRWGTSGRWDNPLRWGTKNNPPLHPILQPRHPGVHFLKIIEWSLSTLTRKMLANHVFRRLMLFSTHLLLLLQPLVLWLSIVTFNNDAQPPPKWIVSEFDVLRIRPRLSGLLHLEMFTWQNLTPAERVTRSGDWRINVIKLELEIIWKGGLPYLPGVPHLQVNRP